jgi:curved DNA-binding protein CbpA
MVLPAGINLTLAPRLTSFARTADLRALDLQPTDGFVLSRIDGQATGETIARTTGLDDEDVRESLAVLIQNRLVEMPAVPNIAARTGSIMPHDLQAARVSVVPPANISGSYVQVSPDRPSQRPRNPMSNAPPAPPPSQPRPYPSAAPPPPRHDTPTTVAQVNVPRPPPTPTPPPRSAPIVTHAAPSYPPPSGPVPVHDPAAASAASAPYVSADGIDIEPEFRARVEEVYATLDSLDYYTLLGIDRSGDKKVIKRAYYELAANFHPDKYFRKNLGPYKAKMEAIFGRFTIAHDTLTSKADRAEYDAYLGIRETTREQEDRLAGAQEEIRRAEEDLQRATQQSVAISVNPVAAPVSPSSPPPGAKPLSPASPAKSFDAQAAREALARKLLGGAGAGRPSSMGMAASRPSSAPAGSGRPSQANIPAQMNPRDAVDALKRRYEATITDSRSAQVQKYKKNAEELIAKGDYAAGLNSLRVALSFDPDNADLYALTLTTQKQADEILSVNYEKQARYEEKADNWREAARSWTKVARARPNDAGAHERAANALLRGGGNMREASELAKRAVTLEPQNPMHRATLAAVYIGGGMILNAKREVEAALAMAPTHPAVLHVARRLKEVG